jgi:exosortase A-associated hydrolase 1
MSRCDEQPVWFACESESLLGIVARPLAAVNAELGVGIVVGGAEYRVGRHRQFTQLARRIASEGFPTLRFDYRGMGDSTGAPRAFTDTDADIDAAVRTLRQATEVRAVVLWGLCDAASAALLAVRSRSDIAGLVLVNPWTADAAAAATVPLGFYYGARIRNAAFWRKLLSGKVSPWQSIRSLASNALAMLSQTRRRSRGDAQSFQTSMAQGWRSFSGPILLALSGNDFTSRQFIDYASQHTEWDGLLSQARVSRRELPEADHTFSSAAWRAWLEEETVKWLERAFSGRVPSGPFEIREETEETTPEEIPRARRARTRSSRA